MFTCEKIMHWFTPQEKATCKFKFMINSCEFFRIWSKIKWLSLCLGKKGIVQTKWESFYFWSNSKECIGIDLKFEFTRCLFLGIIFSQIIILEFIYDRMNEYRSLIFRHIKLKSQFFFKPIKRGFGTKSTASALKITQTFFIKKDLYLNTDCAKIQSKFSHHIDDMKTIE